ncbi:amino acid ABC transporter ATP-binding/permease protein [Litoreibacter janthinus]|uniref:ATP-binding cassette, subfamily C, CydC n=1 Tax=Litoreibacter janthinus TaxID=670154 RepID=A0A1I6HHG9_9RHOB|nr:ATP-binding cassette domain-containing protein [Litoreibacter janthinus]SFR53750.1 ATP-binding cassette, subfamily C, CydC [Litoreibacter janthinus]
MKALWTIFQMILSTQRAALTRGALLSLVVLLMGAALLGLSGWFITAAAAAGLAGLGAVFDVFRPSAMVRFLALGRAAARYGERVLTHDATLRALEVLRLRLLGGLLTAEYARMIRLRGAQALNRLTADVDALDGISLRLVLPVLAGIFAQLTAFVVLWVLVGLPVALWVLVGFVGGAALIFWRTAQRTAPLSRRAEAAGQAFRSRFIDLIRARRDLAVQGRLTAQADFALAADERRFDLQRVQDRAERQAGAAMQVLGSVVGAGALFLGITMAQGGSISPALAALGFFTTLALAETLAPLRRGAAELGRMVEAARRVSRDVAQPAPVAAGGRITGGVLRLEGIALNRMMTVASLVKNLSLTVELGETVAMTGPSGAGKSTVLLALAGLHPLAAGQITFGGVQLADLDEAALREQVALLPQRSALMEGTVADVLRLADPQADDVLLWRVLAAVQLDHTLAARQGLSTWIGARGEGVSGGEARRLTLARVLLRTPSVLLLDEPTEGLDEATAAAVLRGIRAFLPQAAIVVAAHRRIETQFADRVVALNNSY